MQKCVHCNHENREGVVFCEQCGVALTAVSLSTRQFVGGEGFLKPTDELGPEHTVVFQIQDAEAPLVVQMRSQIMLGRLSESSPEATYINLAPYGADEAGVSRKHARLLCEGKALYLMDLNSTNGTSVNGEPLHAGVERRIRDGDELKLGQLKLYIYLK